MSTLPMARTSHGFEQEQIDIIKNQIAPKGTTNDELALFLMYCERTGLDPFARQIYLSERKTWNQDRRDYDVKRSPETTIDGFRLIAERTNEYQGQVGPFWCGPDGDWKDVWLSEQHPSAAKVGVWRKGFKEPIWGIALYKEYVQTKKDGTPNSMWQKMAANQLAKCFTPNTEVLTTHGFERFDSVKHRILQVTDSGLESCDAPVFSQPYQGPMITANGDMLNFSVTPNHDMVTTLGKVEARAIYETSPRVRPLWYIPLCIEGTVGDAKWSDEDLVLAGAIAADGSYNGHLRFRISVSRPHKIQMLEILSPASCGVQHSKGSVAVTESREIRSNFDKKVFTFEAHRVSPLLGTDKVFAPSVILDLSMRQARLVLDSWVSCDGHSNKKTGVRRLYTSREDHLKAIELLACVAGYSVNVARERNSDIGTKTNYAITISQPKPQPVKKYAEYSPQGMFLEQYEGLVWCVTVPSGRIIVRRNGFSMVCGNCAESLSLRKGFPRELSGMYSKEEMAQSEKEGPELQQEVARLQIEQNNQRRIAEGKAPILEANPKPIAEDSPQALEMYVREGKDYEQRHAALVMEAAEILEQPPAPKAERKRGDISFAALKKFKEMKAALREASGTDATYYQLLSVAGVEHADSLNTVEGREVYKAMTKALKTFSAAKQTQTLEQQLEHHKANMTDGDFMRCLGVHGFENIAQVVESATGTQLDGLLRDLRPME